MRTLVLGLVAMFAVTACGAQSADQQVVAANNAFGFAMFRQLVGAKAGEADVVISPASLSLALSMTYNGAAGSTKEAMAGALGYTGLSLDQVNVGNKALVQDLQKPGDGIELSIANSLWARKGVEFKQDFLQRNNDSYQAKITTLDFASPGAADTINGWVKEQTKGKIDSIIGGVSPQDILYLVNAIYFKGLWSAPFDEKATIAGKFELGQGRNTLVPMMHRTGDYEYLEGKDFQLINLSYGKGRISMYVLLPGKGISLDTFYADLTQENWDGWMKQIHDRMTEVNFAMPKLKLEYKIDAEVERALTNLGMGVAFDAKKADFKAMCKIPPTPNVYIGEVVHKTFVEVNEKGTEAAAATSVGMRATAAPLPRKTVKMTVNRPFFFAIRDNETGEMLFMASIATPKMTIETKH